MEESQAAGSTDNADGEPNGGANESEGVDELVIYPDDSEDSDDDDSEDSDDDDEAEEAEVLMVEAVPLDTSCMTISQAYSMYPAAKVDEAIEKELSNMIDMKVFGLVSMQEHAGLSKKVIVPSKFFLKDKGSDLDPQLKGRFVGGGHRQDEQIYEKKSSPTAGTSTIMVMVADASHHGKYVLLGDIPCAYLHASRGNLPKVYVRLGKEMAAALVKMKPEYAVCLEEDGTLVVEALKGLYGLVESGHTWYTHLTSFLLSKGFNTCEYDKCVFKKVGVNLYLCG